LGEHEKVLTRVLSKIKPNAERRGLVLGVVKEAVQTLRLGFSRVDGELEVRLEGSLAKDTWLVSDVDADVFVLFPPKYDKQAMGDTVIDQVTRMFGSRNVTLRYAEHPYATVRFRGVDIDVVPCFRSTPPNWLSATDRTIYHTKFVNENLSSALKDQARLFKAFLKGIEVYGAEIRVEGFSGFLSELLVLWSGGFLDALKRLSRVKLPLVVDVKGLTTGRDPSQIVGAFRSDFIVIDPVDVERNVASSVSTDNLADLVWAARAFLASPSESYFFGQRDGDRGSGRPRARRKSPMKVLCIKLAPWGVPPDVLWGQLHRIRRKIEVELVRTGFNVYRSGDWTDESREALIFFCLDADALPGSFLHVGPSAFDYESSEAFLRKHRSNKGVISGPFIKDGRWMIVASRERTEIRELLRDFLTSERFSSGLSKEAALRFRRAAVLTGDQLASGTISAEGMRRITRFRAGRKVWM